MRNLSITQPTVQTVNLMSYNKHNTGNFNMSSTDFSVFCRYLYSYMQKGPYQIEIAELFKQAATYMDISILLKHDQSSETRKSRNEELFDKFMTYIKQYGSTEHTVMFYADKLCITPQYLSKISKDVTGRPACEWINEYLTMEAKTLLGKTNLTIQDVSFRMNFSDQSSFGKFFKKHTGVSPKEYVKKTMKEKTFKADSKISMDKLNPNYQ